MRERDTGGDQDAVLAAIGGLAGRTRPSLGSGIIACVDPGLQVCGVALFHAPSCRRSTSLASDPAGWVGVLRGFLGVTSYRVPKGPGLDLTHRVGALAQWFGGLLKERQVVRVVMEVPYKAGAYRGQRGVRQKTRGNINAAAEAGHNQAISALRVACSMAGVSVTDFRAAYGIHQKAARWAHFERAMWGGGMRAGEAGASVPPIVEVTRVGLRLPDNEHERDAAFLGMFALALELNP